MTKHARTLALEHADNPLRLDRKGLTVIADTMDGPLSLSQMGSGENWVGYHVAAHLGLHTVFRQRRRPVPGLRMLDQPSQVHYPPEQDNEGKLDELTDEDQAAVKNLFKLLWDYCQRPNANMQIIVSDHVELLETWFRDPSSRSGAMVASSFRRHGCGARTGAGTSGLEAYFLFFPRDP